MAVAITAQVQISFRWLIPLAHCWLIRKAMHRFMPSAAPSSSGRVEQPATVSGSSGSAEQPATPSDLKLGDSSADCHINNTATQQKGRSATQQKGRKRKGSMRNKENADRNTGAENPQATAHASWQEREKAAKEQGVLDARKMLGEELPTRTAEKSTLKRKVWALLRLGAGCTFKHAAHAENISASSKCAHAARSFPSRREAACYLKAGADVLEGATTREINKLLHVRIDR